MAQQKGHMLIMENASDIIEAERFVRLHGYRYAW